MGKSKSFNYVLDILSPKVSSGGAFGSRDDHHTMLTKWGSSCMVLILLISGHASMNAKNPSNVQGKRYINSNDAALEATSNNK